MSPIRSTSRLRKQQVPDQAVPGPDPTLNRADKTTWLEDQLSDCDDVVREKSLREELIATNMAVAASIAGGYRSRGVALEDLEQIAFLALTKAAQRFDAKRGHAFLSYCVPTIRGEVRRHFRDHGWMVRPPRRVQEMQARLTAAEEQLNSSLGRSPTEQELAEHLEEDLDQVREARDGRGCFTPTSLDEPVGATGEGTLLGDLLCVEDRDQPAIEAKVVLAPVVRRLSERERRILRLRFYEDMSQQQIAEVIGVTQTQVSRLLSAIFGQLRSRLVEGRTTEPQASQAR